MIPLGGWLQSLSPGSALHGKVREGSRWEVSGAISPGRSQTKSQRRDS